MKKSPVLAAAIAIGLFTAPPLLADDDSGLYVGGSLNRLSADFRGVNDLDFDDSDNALGVRIGYMFNSQFGIEGGYLDLGDYRADAPAGGVNLNIDSDGFYGAGVLNLQLSDRWDAYGKLGLFVLDSDSDLTDFEESSTELFGTLGIQFDLGPVDLFGEFSKIDTAYDRLSLDMISFGLNYQFAQ